MAEYKKEERRKYITILADGRFHQTVSQNTEGAVIREYETSDGKKGSKHELVFREITAKVVNLNFIDGDYGQMIELTLDDGAILSVGAASRFGSDILKRLPNVDFDKDILFMPWAMEDEGRKRTGIIIKQDGERVESYFEAQAGDGKWIQKNGLPKPKSDMTKTQWRKYFMDVQSFLVEYASDNISPKLNNKPLPPKDEADDIADSIPF